MGKQWVISSQGRNNQRRNRGYAKAFRVQSKMADGPQHNTWTGVEYAFAVNSMIQNTVYLAMVVDVIESMKPSGDFVYIVCLV